MGVHLDSLGIYIWICGLSVPTALPTTPQLKIEISLYFFFQFHRGVLQRKSDMEHLRLV